MSNSQNIQGTNTQKRARRANITAEEDIALCNAYVKITLDASIGTDQSSSTFWGRVNEVYSSFQGVGALSDKTLAKKYSTIQKSVSAYVGYLTRVPRTSGSTQVDWIERARQDYLRVEKKPFTYDHVFQILQMLPKFNPNHTENQSLEGIEGSASQPTPRPKYGRKAEKERQRANTSKRRVEAAQEIISSTDDFMSWHRENHEKKEARRDRIEKKMDDMTKIQREQTDYSIREYNARMMFMDTSSMNPMQLQYHQQEIARITSSSNQFVAPNPVGYDNVSPPTGNAYASGGNRSSRGKTVLNIHDDNSDDESIGNSDSSSLGSPVGSDPMIYESDD